MIYRLLLSFSAISWIIVVYIVKSRVTLFELPWIAVTAISIAILIIIAIAVLNLTKILEIDEVSECKTFSLADNEYLPVYLGYSFVALSINDCGTLIFIFCLIWLLTVFLDAYFNPFFILLGYHYYKVTTINDTELFLICKSTERNPHNVSFDDLRRINNRTYISHGGS